MQVGLHRVPCQRLEGRLGAKYPGGPICLRVEPAERAEQWAAHAQRQHAPHALFHHVHPVAPVAAKALIAAITGQRHGHVLAGQLADAVRGNRGAIRIRLVIQLRQLVDQVEILALDLLDEVLGVIAIRHLLGVPGLVELRIVEGDRAGIDGLGRDPGHGGHDGARIDST